MMVTSSQLSSIIVLTRASKRLSNFRAQVIGIAGRSMVEGNDNSLRDLGPPG